MSRLRVFIATSLDGFISGPNHDLSWLPEPTNGEDFGWAEFIREVGCILMGRTTYDTVRGMGVPWPYERPTIVATNRTLTEPPRGVFAERGSIEQLVDMAKVRAGGKDVYIDGGDLIRQALDADLIDEAIVTICPTILGAGSPLFAGSICRHPLQLKSAETMSLGVVQTTYIPINQHRE